MSGDLNELYQSVILDHNKSPRNFRALADATGHAEGRNPLCGDAYTVWVRMEGDRIAEASFQGNGCAISKASASLMTTAVTGKTAAEADALFATFHALLTGGASDLSGMPAGVRALAGVKAFPMRVKCATLSWHAMKEALTRGTGS